MAVEPLQLQDVAVNFDTDESLKEGAGRIVSKIRPTWPEGEFKYKIFTDGISNKLVGVYVEPDKNSMVLVRVYGAKTELIIDRDAEVRNMRVLHEAGCGAQLYAQFANGLAYEFLPGETLTIESAKSPDIYPAVAEAVAKMHKVVDMGPSVPRTPCMWSKLRLFLGQIPDGFPDNPEMDRRLKEAVMSKQQLAAEVEQLESKLKDCGSPVVFTHNDLLLANIVTDGAGRVHFIDYEYGDYNYQECDVANHFCEMAGVEDMDFVAHYPSPEFQKSWVRAYLAAFDGRKPDEKRVESFAARVDNFSLCYHLMWGMWGLVQAKISTISFDFIAFATARLNEYKRVKGERLQ